MSELESEEQQTETHESGFDDLVALPDLNESSLLRNLRIRYESEDLYTHIGSILLSINPYKMLGIYGLDMVKKYEGQILGSLPPHLFAIGSCAYSKMIKDREDQVLVISGESGSGKTECTKLIMQYLAAVNKSPSNIVTEQILEATPLLEAFGNAKTSKNNNSSRFGKYLEIHFKEGVITGARTTEYLLEKSRIVTQANSERNYHVFYELLAGLTHQEKEKYGLQTAEKYFYLNQGGSCEIEGKNDAEDFRFLLAAIQVLGFTNEEQDVIFRILASVLHIGNIYFNRKQMKHGQEGVEIGSDAEVRWASHLLQIPLDGILKALTFRTTEARNERMLTPLNIDQSLDARDAIAKSLYGCLFSWLVQRINLMVYKSSRKTTLALLDIFGFENFEENNFEQLCINYANETLQYYYNKHVFRLEQQEYAKEKIEWQPITYIDNQNILHLISKKPIGIMPLLDDESNFPKASDQSFLEKCHFNHALNELYSRPRLSSMEFGIKHFAGQVWYSVDGFLDKNRDTLRSDVVALLISSKMSMISKMFRDLRNHSEYGKSCSRSDGRFITMKPRTPTVSSRFQDSLNLLIENMSKCNPWFVRCIKPNNEKAPIKFDVTVVREQLRFLGILETIKIRKLGFPIRIKFNSFVDRYKCLIGSKTARNMSSKEVCKAILDKVPSSNDHYQLANTKVFMKENLEQALEVKRIEVLRTAVVTVQKYVRGFITRKKYKKYRTSVIKIQSLYRGYTCKRKYIAFLNAIIRIQATWRMKRQKREYENLKAILARKRESEKAAFEKAKERAAREEQERARAVAGVNHLEIPAELAFIFSKLDDWECVHTDKQLVKANGQVSSAQPRLYLPLDIDHHAFTKFTNIYFRSHVWGMKREPIKTPFLTKTNESDTQESLAIFKLILRFMNDSNLSGRKEKVLADYIIQKGLGNEALRDEILCQLCNQTFKNDNDANNERGWLLMANCLSCFLPSTLLFKYLLKYVSDHAFDGFKSICQQKLLQSERVEVENCRTYPPCLLEWKSTMKKSNMAVEAKFSDGDSKYAAVESWTTAEQFAANVLKSKGFDDTFGWTVELDDDGDVYGLNGNDYVLDVISQMEIPPSFPVCNSYFVTSADRNKGNGTQKLSSSAHNPEKINKLDIDIMETASFSKQRSHSRNLNEHNARNASKKVSANGELRAKSVSREHLTRDDTAVAIDVNLVQETTTITSLNLSRNSRLNQRYMQNNAPEEPLDLKLSPTSKLNQRYICSQTEEPPARDRAQSSETKSLQKRSMSLQELGLACSALNDRYFASRQNLHKTSSLTGDSEHLDGQLSKVASAFSLQESSRADPVESNARKYKQEVLMKKSHLIRPSSRSSSSSLSSSTSPGDVYSGAGVDESDIASCSQKGHEFSSRYVKYSGRAVGGQSRYPPYSHSTKASIDRSTNRELDYSQAPRSSALSDTSEAPSLASHVKNVKIPSHTSDLDQYLDDLFNPVLDGNLDELSDARSLAASIKGGSIDNLSFNYEPCDYPFNIFDEKLEYTFCNDETNANSCFNDISIDASNFDALSDPEKLVVKLKGGGNEQLQLQSTITFGTNNVTEANNAPRVSPNVNSPFTNVAGMTVPMVDTSQIIQQQLVHQQMIQRAFLASAVQQNLQIQQQLLQQNQALQQLLHTAVSPNSTNIANDQNGISPSPTLPMLSPLLEPLSLLQTVPMDNHLPTQPLLVSADTTNGQKHLPGSQNTQMTGNQKEVINILNTTKVTTAHRMTSAPPPPPPLPPPSPPPLSPNSSYADVYGRAKTVRIGKWRWPPPRDEVASTAANSFFEFKLKRQQEKCDKNGDVDKYDDPNLSLLIEMQKNEENRKERTKSERVKSFSTNEKSKESVGKLRISSEMKAKLEQLTIDQSVRSKKNSREKLARSMEDIREGGVKKLSEHRKALLERQLMGSMKTLHEVGINHIHTENEFRLNSSDGHTKVSQTYKQELEQIDNLMKFSERFSVSRRSGSRESRERRDELGPHNRTNAAASTIQAECGDHLSQSAAGTTLFDQVSVRNSIGYEESVASSVSPTKVSREVESLSFSTKPIKRMSVPPPPPPTAEFLRMNSTEDQNYQFARQGSPSMAASSSYCGQNTPIVVRRKEPPPAPVNFKMALDRLSLDRLEFVESSEFLNPVEVPPPAVVDRRQQQAAANIKTKLYPPANTYHLTYNKVQWNLNVRKEVFLPSEKIENPSLLHLIFCQVVKDVFSSNCIRLTKEEKKKFQRQLNNYGITLDNLDSSSHKLPVQKNVIEFARELPTYFCRLYTVSGGRNLPNVTLLGVSHSGIRLLQRERDSVCDFLRVLDTLRFQDIAEVAVPRSCTVQFLLRNGAWLTLYTYKATQIRQFVEKFIFDICRAEAEFVKAVSDHIAVEPSLLNFSKGSVIRLVSNKNLHIAKGWLYGILESGESGIFPCEYVVPLTKDEMIKLKHKMDEIKRSLRNGRSVEDNDLRSVTHQTQSSAVTHPPQMLDEHSSLWVESKVEQISDSKYDGSQNSHLNDGKFSLLQFALFNFKEAIEKYDLTHNKDGSLNGTIKFIESLKSKKKNKKSKNGDGSDWTWKELSDLVKFSKTPLSSSLLKLASAELSKLSVECFLSIMRFMGDNALSKNQTEVDCVYTILMNCHKYPELRDELYCQIIKQTTNNKSTKADSCQRGWRLFAILAAYFDSSDSFRPYLVKYLETSAYDKRRPYHATAMVCLQNFRKTLKYGGRRNVPSIEEITAISAGRNSRRQIYRLPGGSERIVNTKSSTVVADVIEEICQMLGVSNQIEMEEFSLYCIIEGDPYTMPLNKDEYILDVTTELLKNGQIFYLIFCRSVWFHSLRLDNQLYIEVIFNQVAPDYLEGLLLVTPSGRLPQELTTDISRIAALLHRAADMEHVPTKDEVKYLLPKPVLPMKDIRPPIWVEMVQQNWSDMAAITTTEAKAQCLDILQKWPLFGSCFFAVKRIQTDSSNHPEFILALNKNGAHFLDVLTHETVWKYPYSEIISTRKVRAEDGTLFLDMKCGNLMVQKITRIQTDQAHEISRLIRQYINIQSSGKEMPHDITLSRTVQANEMHH